MSAESVVAIFDPRWWTDTPLGFAHLAGATIALLVGPVILLRRKGDTLHRTLGYVYVTVMLLVNTSALVMYELTGGPNLFHFFALLSIVTITPGIVLAIRARRTGNRRLLISHYFFMSWSYFGLFAAFASQLGTQLGPMPAGLSPFAVVGIATFLMAAIASVVINRNARPVIQRYGLDRG